MKSFTLYNSELRHKVEFVPKVAGQIGLYVCGMTVYDYCHIGHARTVIAFDYIVRFLRSQGWQVNYVRNITDIDDKIIKRANENNESISELTTRFINAMNEDFARLGCVEPDQAPKATDYIPQMQSMINTLIDKGHAYNAPNGDVYYAVESFATYGRLSGRKLDDMQAGASERTDVEVDKKNPFDFVLWKAAKPNEPAWQSPWGNGRPGWHIECSAMSTCTLGNNFDLHGGGGDLLFPHHENEIAQSEGATGETYANNWLHVGFINVDGEKMSKSLGNFFTIRDVMQQFAPEVIRYFIISSHYRSPINFSDMALKEAKQALNRFYNTLKLVQENPQTALLLEQPINNEAVQQNAYVERFNVAMSDDFNTPEALAVLFDIVREINRALNSEQFGEAGQLGAVLKYLGGILGLLQQAPDTFLKAGSDASAQGLDDAAIAQAISDRQQAKLDKDYAKADQIRKDLLAQGIVLEDSKAGTTWRREG